MVLAGLLVATVTAVMLGFMSPVRAAATERPGATPANPLSFSDVVWSESWRIAARGARFVGRDDVGNDRGGPDHGWIVLDLEVTR